VTGARDVITSRDTVPLELSAMRHDDVGTETTNAIDKNTRQHLLPFITI